MTSQQNNTSRNVIIPVRGNYTADEMEAFARETAKAFFGESATLEVGTYVAYYTYVETQKFRANIPVREVLAS